MPDTIENDFTPAPAGVITTPPGANPSHPDEDGAEGPRLTLPDLMPLLDVAEGRINFTMSMCENALRSAMRVSAAGLECGTIWSRGWREFHAHAATTVWRTSQISVGASSDLLDRWMDLQVQALDATAARLAETA